VLHFRIAVIAKANYGEAEFRYNSSVTRGGLKEVTTSNEPTDDEVARTLEHCTIRAGPAGALIRMAPSFAFFLAIQKG
jgi:hypothetical protein